MSRLFDRLGQVNLGNGPAFKRWAQKLVEQVEEAIVNVNASLAEMPDIAPVTVAADYTGIVETGQLPRNVAATRFQYTTNVTSLSEWSFTVDSGSITATIGASTGILEITAVGSTSVVTITSVYGGVTKSRKLFVTKTVGVAPSTGSGGGSTATDTSFSSISSDSFTAISDELTVTVGAAGEVALSAPLSVTTNNLAGPDATSFPVKGIWRWWDGVAWADVGSEATSSPSVFVESADGDGTPPWLVTDGAISVSETKTGLTPSASEKFQLYARNQSGTRTMYFTGTATAVGN